MWRAREALFIALMVVILLLTGADLLFDAREEAEPGHLLVEVLVILTSLGGLCWLFLEMRQRQQTLEQVRVELAISHKSLDAFQQQLHQQRRPYIELIQQQFEQWQLTPGEQDVARLMLKGLSFEQIAGVRETREKTVRQQASAIYRKAGVAGRHELAAWFFEDFVLGGADDSKAG